MLKTERQKLILRIISEQNIETQEELTKVLKDNGVETTQATISRDIRQLRLRKKPGEFGRQKYFAPEPVKVAAGGKNQESLIQILTSGIVNVSAAESIIVVKTYSGMAMAVGAAIDNMNIDGVAGCIAGDDTIFVAVTDASEYEKVMSVLRGVSGR